MLKSFTVSEILPVIKGILTQGSETEIRGISTDTRTISKGDLYIPLKGERFNGHEFIHQAKAAGAVAALIDEDINTDGLNSFPLIRVFDCLLALGQIAQYQRRQFTGQVVAVTGSAGKTSVKQLMANVLGQQFSTWMTQGNLNNHIGAPLTLLAIQPEHEAAMIELGASGLKEIAYTAQFVEPDISILTNASEAHLEGFGSLSGIVQTKGEIIDYVRPGGRTILNRDDEFYDVWQQRAERQGIAVTSFGLSVNADIRAVNIETSLQGCHFTLVVNGDSSYSVDLPLLGEHNVRNALAVVAAALAVPMPIEKVIYGLETAEAYKGRLRWCDGAQNQRILDDSYNASPASVYAAIDVLANAENSWLVLGDMAELGDDAESIHYKIGQYAQQQGIKRLVATGKYNKNTVAAFGDKGIWYEKRDELVHYLKQQTSATDVLLVKGSRSAGMDKVVTALQIGEEEN